MGKVCLRRGAQSNLLSGLGSRHWVTAGDRAGCGERPWGEVLGRGLQRGLSYNTPHMGLI